MEVEEIFAAVGEAPIRDLVSAFYAQVPGDDILGPMYPQRDMAGAEERLVDFLLFRFGGPEDYLSKRGHPRLRMRHARFPVDAAARDRWLHLMLNAMASSHFPAAAREPVLRFFASTADFLVNRANGSESGRPSPFSFTE